MNYIFLAISLSIDSLGIGLTYGLKNTKIPLLSKILLSIISFVISSISIFIGDIVFNFLPRTVTSFIGFGILFFLGLLIVFKSSNTLDLNINNSKKIGTWQSVYLGISLSLDSLGICICSSIAGFNSFLFPILIAVFQIVFLSIGLLLGKNIILKSNLPQSIWSVISGILLMIIGISKLFTN